MDAALLLEAALLLAGTPSAPGDELALAQRLAGWVRDRLPALRVALDPFAPGRANVLLAGGPDAGPHLAMYAHLDTSLTGEPGLDVRITGTVAPVPPARVDGGDLVGPGLAVAKAPAAAAIAALALLAARRPDLRVSLLLAAGGTHRLLGKRGPQVRFGAGVRRALSTGFRPDAVLNVKAGAPAPLWEEPGAAYLRVLVRGGWGPALFRTDDPGLAAATGPLLAAVESWRAARRAQPVGAGRTWGREAALGALRFGAPDKPDLLPALLDAEVYAVLVDDDDPAAVAASLQAAVADALTALGPPFEAAAAASVTVDVDASDLPAATDRDDPIVRLAVEAWARRFGPPPEVTGWRGSTDGVVFRAAGIPTVRAGIAAASDAADPRLDRVPLAPLASMAGLYAEVAERWHAVAAG